MEEKIFAVDKATAMKIVDNERVKREGEAEYFDGAVFGTDSTILWVKGNPDLFKMDLFEGLKEAENSEELLKKIHESRESAATGVGMIFG